MSVKKNWVCYENKCDTSRVGGFYENDVYSRMQTV